VNTIAVVLTPGGLGSQLLINGVDVSDACHAVEIHAQVGEPTTVVVTLIGSVELITDVDHVVIVKERTRGWSEEA
jgi:hydroxyethylthiazole kinase-like sugar kinase family protein